MTWFPAFRHVKVVNQYLSISYFSPCQLFAQQKRHNRQIMFLSSCSVLAVGDGLETRENSHKKRMRLEVLVGYFGFSSGIGYRRISSDIVGFSKRGPEVRGTKILFCRRGLQFFHLFLRSQQVRVKEKTKSINCDQCDKTDSKTTLSLLLRFFSSVP